MKSEAVRGTSQEPPALVGKLAESRGRDLLPEWRKLKDEAYQLGMARGEQFYEKVFAPFAGSCPEPYLQYLYLLGVGQAIANHGRDIVGTEVLAAKANDTPGKERK